ncbi:aminotransferase [Mycena sp. CBHHK59/15]|nr:aminotransferase [Mycena sp. CBHHK59/15]
MSSSYELLTTTRWDRFLEKQRWNNNTDDQPSSFLLLHFHLDRLRQAAAAVRLHGWPDAESAAVVSYEGDPADALKIRITLSRAAHLTATASPIAPLKFDPTSPSFSKPLTDSATLYGSAMTLFVDTQPMPPGGLFTATKTTERTAYDAARARVGLPTRSPDADVILYNPEELVTESSVANVAFYHAHTWVTPPLSSGCLPGVLRRWLLHHKRIHEAEPGELRKDALRPGDWVLLFNSVQGCRLGRIAAS